MDTMPGSTGVPVRHGAAAPGGLQQETFRWHKGFEDFPAHQNLQKARLAIDEGYPDVRLAPVAALLRECRSIHTHFYGKGFLKYGNPMGSERLRSAIGNYLSDTRGFKAGPEKILITKGSQMGIYIASRLLIETGDIVAVGNSNYLPADAVFKTLGASLVRIPVDENGMDVDFLEALLAHTRIKAVYVIPHQHCPTTVTLSHERRLQLLRLSTAHHFAILEDDFDFDFHYSPARHLPLASYPGSRNVIYIGSISKTFAPAVRIGFMIGPKNFLRAAAGLRRVMEKQGDTLLEEGLASLFESGEMGSHFRKSIKIYKERRDVFCEMLYDSFREYTAFNVPDGGLAVWSSFDQGINLERTAANALRRGLVVADVNCYKNESFSTNSIRMGFASLDQKEMEKALGILKLSLA
jgi:GntR family transcriptional regulator/MocR family aminotransferase